MMFAHFLKTTSTRGILHQLAQFKYHIFFFFFRSATSCEPFQWVFLYGAHAV